MKIDRDYLKGLLEAFQAAKGPFTDIREVKEKGFDYEEDNFIFHSDILLDRGFIESLSPRDGIGYQRMGNGGCTWSVVPLRLTADGHDFIETLNAPNVWEDIQANFKQSSIDTLKSVAKDLAIGYAKKRVSELLSNGSS
ncbi:MAG: DUF2513 domain-containing protein [Marinobacter sp.]|uniref:DUF2513 domain-containing protein n=1 Tax=Marinobacter sp. AC-23 TaxID=1879031 RepID=UPI0008DD1F47|nr:DUF2513 domain-containing protein [Marinobacter sp. AC-23]OHY80611.1 hypothetical protein BCA33_14070 [Marinobacter sp. AC-23]